MAFGTATVARWTILIEELAEEREPGVEARGQGRVRRRVGDEEDFLVVGRAENAVQAGARDGSGAPVGLDRRRIRGGLIDDQVRDDARIRIGDADGAGVVGVGDRPERVTVLIVAEHLIQLQREVLVIGGAEALLARDQVVQRTIDRADRICPIQGVQSLLL